MSIHFSEAKCQSHSNKKKFGLCDNPLLSKVKDESVRKHAYIDENDGAKWIAVVENEHKYDVTFTAVDNCIEIKKDDGKMAKRCDGILAYNATIIFVELKERGALGNDWVIEGEKQLRASIAYFETTDKAANYNKKKAYVANKDHPKFKESQIRRMETFLIETGYVLRFENRITLD